MYSQNFRPWAGAGVTMSKIFYILFKNHDIYIFKKYFLIKYDICQNPSQFYFTYHTIKSQALAFAGLLLYVVQKVLMNNSTELLNAVLFHFNFQFLGSIFHLKKLSETLFLDSKNTS